VEPNSKDRNAKPFIEKDILNLNEESFDFHLNKE
jgi:hypothetical protein